jgi:hypothetical protein
MKDSSVSKGGTQALAVGAVLMAAILGVWWARPDSSQAAAIAQQSKAKEPPGQPSASLSELPAVSTPEVEPEESSLQRDAREDVAVALAIFVRDPNGGPVPGAQVSWTRSSRGARDLFALEPSELAELASSGRRGQTGEAGVVRFDAPPEGESASVVWVTCPGYAPASRWIDGEGAPTSIDVSLSTAAPLAVTVLSAEGEPVPGARVYQLGASREEARRAGFLGSWEALEPGAEVPATEVLQELLHLREADEAGQVEVTSGAPASLFLATSGATCSAAAVVAPGETMLELRLGEGLFSASGTVLAGGEAGPPEGYRVSVSWKQANRTVLLGEATPSASGEWGPLQLPVMGRGHLELTARGGEGFTTPISREFPLAGEMLVVNFQVEPALTQVVYARDGEGSPLADVRVRLMWPEGELWSVAEAWSDADGVALVKGCKPTTVRLKAEASGFVLYKRENVYLPAPDDLIATMERARVLRGQVTFEGEPISDFDVVFWRDELHEMSAQAFSGREDGQFELSGVPTGLFLASAAAEGFAQSAPVYVLPDLDPEELVQFELLPGKQGQGRVVDATTSSPLAGARVQRLTQGASGGGMSRGDAIRTQVDGSFQLTGMSDVERVLVSAPGYEMASVNASVGEHGVVDFGVVPLGSLAPLEVRVLEEGPFVYGKWWFFSFEGPTSIPMTPVQVDGSLTIEGVSAGSYRFQIVTQDGSTHGVVCELLPGEDWLVEFPVVGGKHLEVITEISAEFDNEPMLLNVNQDIDGVLQVFTDIVHDSRKQTVTALHGDRVMLSLLGEQTGTLFAAKDVDLSGPGPYATKLVAEAVRFLVHVETDGDLDPSTGVVGTASLSAVSEKPWLHPCNSDGEAYVYRPAGEELSLMYMVRNQLLRTWRVSREDSFAGTVELKLGPGWQVELEVVDGQSPVPGALWQLCPPGIRGSLMDGRCGDDGRSGVRDLGGGDYRVLLSLPGYWTTEHEVPITSSGVIPLQLRRRGNLRMTLLSSGGTPLPGVAVRLRSIEYGVGVEEWLAAGKLSAETTQLVTDAGGVAQVVGVPHGEYEWSAVSPSGEVSGGVLSVLPGEWAAAELSLVD